MNRKGIDSGSEWLVVKTNERHTKRTPPGAGWKIR
jgi:hypothetical protein